MRKTAPPVTVQATLQDHRVQRESWAVATVLVRQVEGDEIPLGVSEGCEIAAVGDRLGMAAPGERLELRGSWETTRYGLQLRVTEQVSQGVKAPREAARWLERLDGVGPVLARALMDHFGARIVPILSGELEADLTEVRGVSESKAAHILASFAELAIAGDLESVRFLDAIGASRYEATKILQWCKQKRVKPKEVLEGSPYDLMKVKGLGFSRVDRLARQAGCPAHAPARIQAAAMHTLNVIVDRGSTMSLLWGGKDGGLVGETAALLGVDKDLAHQGVQSLAANGSIVLADDEKGRQNAYPTWLLNAEREIYRAAKGIGFADSGGPLRAREEEVPDISQIPKPMQELALGCAKGLPAAEKALREGFARKPTKPDVEAEWDALFDGPEPRPSDEIQAEPVAPPKQNPKEQEGVAPSPPPAPLTPAAGTFPPPPTPAAGRESSCWCEGDPCGCAVDPLQELRELAAVNRAAARAEADQANRDVKPAKSGRKVTHV